MQRTEKIIKVDRWDCRNVGKPLSMLTRKELKRVFSKQETRRAMVSCWNEGIKHLLKQGFDLERAGITVSDNGKGSRIIHVPATSRTLDGTPYCLEPHTFKDLPTLKETICALWRDPSLETLIENLAKNLHPPDQVVDAWRGCIALSQKTKISMEEAHELCQNTIDGFQRLGKEALLINEKLKVLQQSPQSVAMTTTRTNQDLLETLAKLTARLENDLQDQETTIRELQNQLSAKEKDSLTNCAYDLRNEISALKVRLEEQVRSSWGRYNDLNEKFLDQSVKLTLTQDELDRTKIERETQVTSSQERIRELEIRLAELESVHRGSLEELNGDIERKALAFKASEESYKAQVSALERKLEEQERLSQEQLRKFQAEQAEKDAVSEAKLKSAELKVTELNEKLKELVELTKPPQPMPTTQEPTTTAESILKSLDNLRQKLVELYDVDLEEIGDRLANLEQKYVFAAEAYEDIINGADLSKMPKSLHFVPSLLPFQKDSSVQSDSNSRACCDMALIRFDKLKSDLCSIPSSYEDGMKWGTANRTFSDISQDSQNGQQQASTSHPLRTSIDQSQSETDKISVDDFNMATDINGLVKPTSCGEDLHRKREIGAVEGDFEGNGDWKRLKSAVSDVFGVSMFSEMLASVGRRFKA
ncbi:hypothetical protein HDU97_004321 [Phlyctochytrium planicorne]|nr:hypothetical protein HDU97_004321 [Phlyctochytrium planicorne]